MDGNTCYALVDNYAEMLIANAPISIEVPHPVVVAGTIGAAGYDEDTEIEEDDNYGEFDGDMSEGIATLVAICGGFIK